MLATTEKLRYSRKKNLPNFYQNNFWLGTENCNNLLKIGLFLLFFEIKTEYRQNIQKIFKIFNFSEKVQNTF